MTTTKSPVWRLLIGAVAFLALAAAAPCLAQTAQPSPSDSLAVNLLQLLVKKGVVSQSDADALMKVAAAQTAQAKAAEAAAPVQAAQTAPAPQAASAQMAQAASPNAPIQTAQELPAPAAGAVRVAYVPQVVRDQIKEEVKAEVMQKARLEGWAIPNGQPDWLNKVTISGDFRFREQADIYSRNNANDVIDYATFNQNGPVDINPNTNPNLNQIPFLNTRVNHYDLLSIRARLAVDIKASDQVGVGIRVGTGDNNGPNSTTALLGSGDGKMNLWLDRAYVWLRPTSWSALNMGRMPNPFLSTDLLYSEDLNFDGVSGKLRGDVSDSLGVSLVGGAFPVSYQSLSFPTNSMDKSSAASKWLFAGQLEAHVKTSRLNWRVAGAYYDFDHVTGQLSAPCALYTGINQCSTDFSRPEFMQKGNTLFLIRNIQANPADPQELTTPLPEYVGLMFKYKLADLTTQLDYQAFSNKHLTLTGEYTRNVAYSLNDVCRNAPIGLPVNNVLPTGLGNDNPCSAPAGDTKAKFQSGPNAWLVKVAFGDPEPSHFGQWNVSVGYRYIQPDALLDAFNSSDFALGGTNAKGFTATAAAGLYRGSYLQFRWFSSNQVYGPPLAIDAGQLELHVRF